MVACIRRGWFRLASGRESDFYIDLRPLTLSQEGACLAARALLDRVRGSPEGITAVAGLTMGADPLVSTVGCLAHLEGVPLGLAYVRKEAKAHGAGRRVEGPPLGSGLRVAVLEDVVTTGGSALSAREALLSEYGCQVPLVLALVDREEGGREALEAAGCRLEVLYRRSELER